MGHTKQLITLQPQHAVRMALKFKVLLTYFDPPSYTTGEVERRLLAKANAEVVGPVLCRTEDDVIAAGKDVDAILSDQAPLTRKTLAALNRIRVIVNCSVGVDNVDLQAATEKGVFVANVPDFCTAEVAEHTVALFLALWRKIASAVWATKSGAFDWKVIKPLWRLAGKTAGLVGFGRIGQAVAQRLKGFELEIIAYDPLVSKQVFDKLGVSQVTFGELMKRSDVVFVHSALTRENFHMIDEDQLRMMKKTAVIVNAARGSLINEQALLRALREGWVAGAALDVSESDFHERGNPLFKLDNLLVTPHLAWYSEDAFRDLQTKAAEEIVRVLQGLPPKNLVNRESLSQMP